MIRYREYMYKVSFIALFFFLSVLCFVNPSSLHAQGGAITAVCPMTYPEGSKQQPWDNTITCIATTPGGVTTGLCVTGKCLGKSSSSPGGLGGVADALGLTKQIMDLLKGLGGGGGGGGGEAPPSQIPATVCPNGYYNVTQSSTDPCAVYNPNSISDALGGGTSGISGSLLDALNGGTGSASPTGSDTGASGSPTSSTNSANTPATAPVGTTQVVPTTTTSLSGDIKLGSGGATVIANFKQGVTDVAGFFGGSTFGGGSGQSAASRICASRPWAGSGLIASFVPNAFFDGMCSKAGYQVGIVPPQVQKQAAVTQTAPRPVAPAASTTSVVRVNTIPPEVDIWAEPTSVRLGTRAYIFWNARGVDSCATQGPSFTQNSISGGASTVPISGATTFAIECVAPDGTKVTDSVTVNLAL